MTVIHFFNKCCLRYIPDYTYGVYVYFICSIDELKEHHDNLILNQEPNFYITSLSKLMDDTFTSFPRLFVDEMIEKCTNLLINNVTQLSKVVKWNKNTQQIESIYIER